jgi:predicted lipoprotein with Yx(FWY)xxD motif
MDTRSRAVSPVLGSPRRLLLAAGALAALAAVLVVTLVAGRGSASARASGTVTLHKTSLGSVLATRSGRTLYLFARDSRGRSACVSGACVSFWPPLAAKGRLTAGKGVKASLLGTIRRPGGSRQVTYAGHPLYTFALDKGAGQVKGQGLDDFGGRWSAVSAAGTKVVKAPAPPASSGGGGGYGY